MEPFIVSARKYRPQQFEQVVGQQAITRTLLNAIESNHLAQALLFCGPRGVGKTTCARILAKKINEDGSQREGEDFAFNIFELDAASNNSVDDIRNLIDQVRIPPQVGKYKVYIIDEVHMLSQAAFNAFLKTLEEPPRHAIFILATTEKHKIIPTILSRCQIFDFRRITVQDATEYLMRIAEEQGVEAEEEALHIIARKADGAMRDALSIFDRVVSFAGSKLTRKAVAENLNVLDVDVYFQSTDLILEGAIPKLLLHFNEVLSQGFDGHHYINGLASHFRDLMVCRSEETVALLETGAGTRQRFLEQAGRCEGSFLLEALDIANQCDLDYKGSRNHRLLVELCLMKLASIGSAEKKKTSDPGLIPASYFRNGHSKTGTSAASAEVPASADPSNPTAPQPAAETVEIDNQLHATGTDTTAVESLLQATRTDRTGVDSLPGPATGKTVPLTESPPQPAIAETETLPVPAGHKSIAISKPQGGKVSGLSISSIRAKKSHEARKIESRPDPGNLPTEAFEEADLKKHWEAFTADLETQGRKILASSLATDSPKLIDGTTAWIELPNSTMQKEVSREQHLLLDYLRQQLQNYDLQLRITVNEETARQYAFTPEEKYEKLREKNPAIDLLRKTFDLEL